MHLKKSTAIFLIRFLILVIAGVIYINYTWEEGLKKTEDQAIKLARVVESSFDLSDVSALNAESEDINKLEYQQIKEHLMRFVEIRTDVRFVYLYTMKGNQIYFIVDSEDPTSPDYSPPGQIYTEAQNDFYRAMNAQSPIHVVRCKDRWGEWMSVLLPIRDKTTDEVIAVFGLDYSISRWYLYAQNTTMFAIVVVICILLLYGAVHLIMMNNKALREEKQKLALLNNKLREQETLFRTLYEESPYGITFGTSLDNVPYANKMYQKIVGRTFEEITTMGWESFTHPDDIEKQNEFFRQLSKDNKSNSMIKRYIKKDLSVVWTNLTVTPVQIKENEKISYLFTIEDITERVKAEKELKNSERNNEMLLLNLPGMAYRCCNDRNWTMKYISEGCFDLTGYRPESLINNKEISYNDLIVPKYQESVWQKWAQVLKDKTTYSDEHPIITASGEIKWVYENGQGIYDDKGEVESIEGLIIDITKRKQKEDEVTYLSNHDTLTRLYNRRYFEDEKKRYDNENVYPISVIMGDINGLKIINDSFGHTEGDRLIVTIAKILANNCRADDVLARTGGDEFSIILPNSTQEDTERIMKQIEEDCENYRKSTLDDSHHLSISLGGATKTSAEGTLNHLMKDAEDNMYRHKMLQSKSLHSAIILSMKTTLAEKNQETEEHAHRLIEISGQLGKKMNLSEKQLNELELLSTLHDIGKIGISDIILKKPSKLTDEEWLEMKKHPEIGYRIAMSTSELSPIAEYILCHHERWDGKGYPQGLSGEQIPLLSRIIAVADSYDAMTQDRSYRKAMSKEAACAEIKVNAGAQFDPKIAELFLQEIVYLL